MPDPAPEPRSRRARLVDWSYRLFPLLLLPVLLLVSRDYGNTWDEKIHQINGETVWQFWKGTPVPAAHPTIELYGALFDFLCVAVQHVVPGDSWTTRHYVNAVFGWLGILFTGRLAALLFGRGAGLLAMALLTLCPRYLGHAMNNPKDVPFAALWVAALYFLARMEPRPPYLRWRSLLGFALAAALALNVRAGALLLLGFLGVGLTVAALRAHAGSLLSLWQVAGRWTGAALFVLVFGTVLWPWALVRPLSGPFVALEQLSKFRWKGSVLFDGVLVPARSLPWSYVPTWTAIALPPALLAGAVLSLRRLRVRADAWACAGLWAATAFPVAYVMARHSTLYNGLRHLLFVLPTLVVLAAAGWTALLGAMHGWPRRLAVATLVLGLAEPALFCFRNHPNEVVYFSPLIGGPRGAFGRFDMDYWGNCVLQEVQWADRLARRSGVPLVVSGQPPHVVQIDAGRFDSLSSAGPEQGLHHLEIAPVWGPRSEVSSALARGDVLHWVSTSDGAVLCITTKGPRFAEVAASLKPASR